jgi:hypothetical protein
MVCAAKTDHEKSTLKEPRADGSPDITFAEISSKIKINDHRGIIIDLQGFSFAIVSQILD